MQTHLTNAKEPIERTCARQFSQQVGVANGVLVASALLVAIILHGRLPEPVLHTWLGATAMAHLVNIGLALLVLKHLDNATTRQHLWHLWPAPLFLSGLAWGVTPLAGLVTETAPPLQLCLIVLGMLSSLSVSTLCLHKPSLYAFLTAVLLPTAFWLGTSNTAPQRCLGLGAAVWLLLLGLYGWYQAGVMHAGIQAIAHNQLLNTRMDGQVAELRAAWRALRQLATRDALTEVYNRRALMEHLAREMVTQDRSGRPLGLLRVDADQLRQVNDTLGYLTGDEALKAMAKRIQLQLRGSDFLCRFESDTFVCVVHADNLDKLAQTAERVRASVSSRPLVKEPHTVSLTACVGGTLRAPGETTEQVIQRVTEALHRARQSGPDQVMVLPAA